MYSLICVSRHIVCISIKTLPFLQPGGQGRRKLLGVLDSIDFVQNYPPSMELKFFKQSAMEQVIASCEQRDETGIQLCNVKLLYQVLTSELNKLQGGSTGQRPHMLQASLFTESILRFCLLCSPFWQRLRRGCVVLVSCLSVSSHTCPLLQKTLKPHSFRRIS